MRGDEGKLAELMEDDYFNSRPCVMGDCRDILKKSEEEDFNSRPCVRGDWKEK